MKMKTLKYFLPTFFFALSTTAQAYPIAIPTKTISTSSFEAVDLSAYVDQKPWQTSAQFFALALKAWNPSLNLNDLERTIRDRVEQQGIMKAIVEPTLAMMDLSYAAGRPDFGKMLNPMLRELVPNLAQNLNQKYGLPLSYNGRSLKDVMAQPEATVLSRMQTALNEQFTHTSSPQRFLNPKDDFMKQTIFSEDSYLGYTVKNPSVITTRHNEDDFKASSSNKKDWVSTPRTQYDDEKSAQPKGLFSNLDLVSFSRHDAIVCASACIVTVAGGMTSGATGAGMISAAVAAPLPVIQVAAITVMGTLGVISCAEFQSCKDMFKSEDKNTSPRPKTNSTDPETTHPGPKNSEPNDPPKQSNPEPTPPKDENPNSGDPKQTDDENPPKAEDDGGSTPKGDDNDSDDGDNNNHPEDIEMGSNPQVQRFIERERIAFDLKVLEKKFGTISTPRRGDQ